MKNKVIRALIITFAVLLSVNMWLQGFTASANAPVLEVLGEQAEKMQSTLSNLVEEQYSTPTKISIPSVGVLGNIEPVGVNEDGAMGVPSNFSMVGWLKTSSKIGQGGNLVLSGHYDTSTGAPAIFFNLPNVTEGQHILVSNVMENGAEEQKEYIVTKVYLADPSNVDHIKEAYKKTKHPTITLITCNGIWDPVKQEYSHRVVVKGELIN